MCVTRLIDMFDMTHSWVWPNSYVWPLREYSYAQYDRVIRVTCLVHVRDMTHSNVSESPEYTCTSTNIHTYDVNDLFVYVTWLIWQLMPLCKHSCKTSGHRTHSGLIHICDSIYVTWKCLVTCDMAHALIITMYAPLQNMSTTTPFTRAHLQTFTHSYTCKPSLIHTRDSIYRVLVHICDSGLIHICDSFMRKKCLVTSDISHS
jgi:hypothetical protein